MSKKLNITRYKIHKWFNLKKNETFYGIDVIVDGKSYHVKEDKPVFFKEKSDAIKYVRKANKELREKQPSKTNKLPQTMII